MLERAIQRAAVPAFLLIGCSDETVIRPAGGEQPGANDPLYAIMYEVFDDLGSSSYLSVIDDLDTGVIDPATAREYPGGRAFLRTYNGWVFVGDPTSPIVTRYSVAADGSFIDERMISFGNFGLEAGVIDTWSLTFVSPTKAYLFDAQGTNILWDPTSMEILGAIEAPAEFLRAGLTLATSSAVVRGNRLYRSLFWRNDDNAEYSADQLLVIYDVENDVLLDSATETRCPSPENLAYLDEDGTIYFSNWIWSVAGTLMYGAPQSCVLRIPNGSERFDTDWSLPFSEISGGHEGGMFTYLEDGKGLAAIFDDSRISFDAMTDPWEYAGSGNWSIWSVDLPSRQAAPIAGIPLNAGAYTPALLDGRLFLIVPEEGWDAAAVYEVRGTNATPSIQIPGWSYAFEKIR